MKPLLLIDIDGVILPFGGEPPEGCFLLPGGIAGEFCSPIALGLFELADCYQLVWCTAWEHRAESELARALRVGGYQVPSDLEVVSMPGDGWQEHVTWKLPAVRDFVGDRAVAWVDDELRADAQQWAAQRQAPTLLVRTQASQGVTQAQLESLREWAQSLAPDAVDPQ